MSAEEDNHRRWANDERGRYEVWYATWNDPKTGQGFWLRYITEAPVAGALRGELWFARFDPNNAERTFGMHKAFPTVESATTPFRVEIGGAQLGHDHAIGELVGGGHVVEWNLRWDAAAESLRLLPGVAYLRGGLFETTVLSPNARVAMSGTLVVDGEMIAFERVVFGQSHVWGKKHAFAWTWGHCADFPGAPDAVLELYAGRLQRRGVTTPPTVLAVLRLDGKLYELNQLRHLAVNRARWRVGQVELTATSLRTRIEVELTAPPDAFVNAPYEDPDGTHLWCANTEIGDARLVVFERAGLGWREVRRLDTRGRAHFEIGSRERDPSVVREHVLV